MDHNSRIKVIVYDGFSVGHVVRSILGGIFHGIRVVDRRYIVHKRCRLLGMLGRAFLVSMSHWIIGRNITKHILWR